ncbi:MAG: FeoB-associated Cys-rich membrane protein [bacterium]
MATVIIATLLFVAMAAAARHIIKAAKAGKCVGCSGCGGHCDHCAGTDESHRA